MDTAVNPVDTDAACQGNWNTDPNCKANNGARCLLDSDCTGGGTCQDPVNAASTYSISIAQAGGELCNPMCNNVASFTATVDFDQSTDATSEFSIQRGCYDERFAAGMRRLGASGSGAGQQNVHLDWKVLIPDGEVATKPLVLGDGSVVVASVKGSLTRISPAGEKYWSIYVGMVMGNPALGSDGTIYFGSGDRNVWAVTSNGITRWRFTTPMPVHASPLVTDTGVYIGDRNGTFYRFNLDGSVAWRFYTAGELLGGSAMTRDGRVVFGSMDKSFYCLNATTGLALWRVDAGQEIVGTPLVQDVSIVFGTRESDDEYGRVIALKMDGSERWTYTASGSIESLPAEGANGEVYVSTTDGKVYAIQADGQLLWRYNTGGTGGVCKQATYSSHGLTVGTGAADPEAGTAVVLDTGTAAISTADSYYTGFRATFTLASGYLRVGQFHAVDRVFLKYVPEVATHDTDFTDSAGGDTAVAISFRTKDRMIPGETISVALPGMFQADDTAVELYPADLGADCVTGNTVCKPAGQAQFTGVAVASTAQSGTATTVVLSATAGENCGLDDACAGSTITFLSGTGAGQTATIVKYVHSSKTATITYVRTPADSTTTYRISAATVSKFTAATDIGSGTHQTLQLTVRSTTGTATCATVDDCTQTLIQLDDTEAAEAGSLDGYLIEFLAGTGAGQTTTCIRYYGSAGDEKCDIEKVQIPASTDTVYRVGPQLAAGEEVTVVVKYGQESGKEFLYPQYAGVATGGSATEVAMGADAGAEDDFYNGLEMEVQFDRTAAATAPAIGATVSTVYQTRITLSDGSANLDIDVGAYIKVNDEIMLVQQIDLGGGSDEFEVLRGRRGTAAATHAASDVVTVLYFAPITDYDQATQTATIDFTLPRAVAADDYYRVHGAGTGFTFAGATYADFGTTVVPFATDKVPSEYTATAGTVKLAAEEDGDTDRADDYYNGAVIKITSGPGEGLRGKVTDYVVASGVATVEWDNLGDRCGSGTYVCGPKGTTDNGYAGTGSDPSAFALSAYSVSIEEVASSYVGSTKTLTLAQLATAVPATINACTTLEAAERFCDTMGTPATPARLEWNSGGWCGAAGGTGWGATSPCYANGLIVTTSSNKFVYGLGADGTVKFKHMTGKRIQSPPRCVTNADKTVTIYTGSRDHFVYRLTADAQKVLRGSS